VLGIKTKFCGLGLDNEVSALVFGLGQNVTAEILTDWHVMLYTYKNHPLLPSSKYFKIHVPYSFAMLVFQCRKVGGANKITHVPGIVHLTNINLLFYILPSSFALWNGLSLGTKQNWKSLWTSWINCTFCGLSDWRQNCSKL